ncbi:MAG TPA: cyclase family protein [Firmicutes bacterium]|nr:cyclase family protein [Bacillota bacterium]
MKKYIDLTLDLSEGMPVFPVKWYPKPKFTMVLTPDIDPSGRYASSALVFMHAGTHVDSPMHFGEVERPIDTISLEVLCGPTAIIDMYDKPNGAGITAADLEARCPKSARRGDRVIIRTGFTTKFWGHPNYFSISPYLTKDAAEWLVEKGFCLVAIDFQTDKPGDATFPVHNTLLRNHVIIVEYLTNVEEISSDRVTMYALPLRFKGLEASPARVIVVEE